LLILVDWEEQNVDQYGSTSGSYVHFLDIAPRVPMPVFSIRLFQPVIDQSDTNTSDIQPMSHTPLSRLR
jgi:hypothetical protein